MLLVPVFFKLKKMKITFYIPLLIVSLFISCNNNNKNTGGHSREMVGQHADHADHGHEAGSVSYTLYSDDYELFVEFPALVVGQKSDFAAHFTKLNGYEPVKKGKLTISLINGNKGIRHRVEKPDSPGIFRPALQPKEAGIYRMLFELEKPSGDVTFEISEIQVFENTEKAAHASEVTENDDVVMFHKEQAWKTDLAIQEVTLQPFYAVIHTSARVKGQPQSSLTINAQANGQVNLVPVIGQSVRKGELLAVIAGTGLENNLNTKLKEAKIAFEKSKADVDRTKPLVEREVISRKDFLEIRTRYQQDSLRYYQLAKQLSGQGLNVRAPIRGFVSNISVSNGQYVENGEPILTVSEQNQLLIEAFVNQSDFQKVPGIFSANFSFANHEKTISLDEINGHVTSKNAFVNENSSRIPVTFSAQNNGRFMPGMYLEAYLKTGRKEEALVIPISAVLEEQGQYFVFIQIGGESFVKKQVILAGNDGIRTEIASGLSVGDRIVTQGAYQIKLAAMAGDLPLHGHTH
jgi:RND family efflux transporter MFP subunit